MGGQRERGFINEAAIEVGKTKKCLNIVNTGEAGQSVMTEIRLESMNTSVGEMTKPRKNNWDVWNSHFSHFQDKLCPRKCARTGRTW